MRIQYDSEMEAYLAAVLVKTGTPLEVVRNMTLAEMQAAVSLFGGAGDFEAWQANYRSFVTPAAVVTAAGKPTAVDKDLLHKLRMENATTAGAVRSSVKALKIRGRRKPKEQPEGE